MFARVLSFCKMIAAVANIFAFVVCACAGAMGCCAAYRCTAAMRVVTFDAFAAADIVVVDAFRSDALVAFTFAICPSFHGFGAVDIVRSTGHGGV